MIAIVKGDIIDSRKLKEADRWLKPLKRTLAQWGMEPKVWEIIWGDAFQLEVAHPETALEKAFLIKSVIRQVGVVDIRMAIGFGDKTFESPKISESNGSAFIFAGEKFDLLRKEKTNLAVKSEHPDFDYEINLLLKLASVFMDSWSKATAQLVEIVLQESDITQEQIGKRLGIQQSAVSGRWKRAHIDELLEVEKMFQKKVQKIISKNVAVH